jgi:prepilin-type N-terminal cleavage/methylation domain-containing protein
MKKEKSWLIGKIQSENGFTLIEVLLVMVILTVLAAVVVPKFTKRSEQAY